MTARWATPSACASLMLVAGLISVPTAAATATTASAPAVGECLEYADIESLNSPGQTVDCSTSHNAEVFAVSTAPDDLGLPSQAFIPDQQRSDLCTPPGSTDARDDMYAYLGLTGAALPLRTYFGLKLPSDEEWRSGERWVRCLVSVSRQGNDGLLEWESWSGSAPERVTQSGAGWLLACNDGVPASGTYEVLVPCSVGRWLLIVNGVRVEGEASDPYPGEALQQSADLVCAPLIRPWERVESTGDFIAALAIKEEWESGGRVASCWIPYANWNGRVTDTPPPPIPSDATLVVTGPTRVEADSAQVFRLYASTADDTPLPQEVVRVTISGSGILAGDLSELDVATAEDGYADVTVVAGKSGEFTLRADLVRASSVTATLFVTVITAPAPEATITIKGSRAKVSKKKGVIITGQSTGLADRARVVPRFKLAGQKKFTAAKAVRINANGAFTWKRVAPKSITVYVTSGKTKSNQITIR